MYRQSSLRETLIARTKKWREGKKPPMEVGSTTASLAVNACTLESAGNTSGLASPCGKLAQLLKLAHAGDSQ